MSKLPAIVFVPGAWHTSAGFQKVIDILSSHHGYECIGLHLPSVGGNPVVKDMEPDKTMIRNTVTKLVEDGKDVVMVSHSYGGLPTNSSLEGLSKTERTKAGRKGGVISTSMISAFLLDAGMSLLGGKESPDWQTQEVSAVLIGGLQLVVIFTITSAAYIHNLVRCSNSRPLCSP